MKNNFDNEIKNILSQMHEVELQGIPEKEELQKRYTLSELFQKRMSKLTRKVEREEKIRTAARNVAATAAVIVMLFCVMKPEIVASAYQVIIREFSNHINFKFKNDGNIKNMAEYEAGYLPEGYVLDGDYSDIGLMIYRNQKDLLYLQYVNATASINVDNEKRVYKLIKGKDGTEIHYFEAKNNTAYSTIMWLSEDENLVFSVVGRLSREELLKIKENIRQK